MRLIYYTGRRTSNKGVLNRFLLVMLIQLRIFHLEITYLETPAMGQNISRCFWKCWMCVRNEFKLHCIFYTLQCSNVVVCFSERQRHYMQDDMQDNLPLAFTLLARAEGSAESVRTVPVVQRSSVHRAAEQAASPPCIVSHCPGTLRCGTQENPGRVLSSTTARRQPFAGRHHHPVVCRRKLFSTDWTCSCTHWDVSEATSSLKIPIC